MAGGALGQAVVEILADVENFDDDVRAQLEASAREAGAAVEREFDNIGREARAAGQRLASNIGDGADRASAAVERMAGLTGRAAEAFQNLDADELTRIAAEAAQAQVEMSRLARAARDGSGEFRTGFSPQALRDIERSAAEASAEMIRLQAQANEARRVLGEFSPVQVRRLAEAAQDAAERLAFLNASRFGRVQRSAQEAGRAILTAFRTGGEEADRALRKINNENFRKLVASAIRAALLIRAAFKRLAENVDIEESILRSGRAFKTLFTVTAGLAGIALRFAAMASTAGAFVAALAPGIGILAAIPSAVALFTAASNTLKVALLGVGDAVKAALGGDSKAFEESIKGLAPAAQKTAREFRALKPQVDKLKSSVQGAFFKPLEGQVKAVGNALLGPLRKGMTGAAGEFGRLGKAVLTFGKSKTAVTLVEKTFGQLKSQLGGIKSGTITGLLDSVAKFTTSVFPAFNGLGGGIDGLLQKLSGFLAKAAKGGDALRWVTEALAVFRQLGRIIQNVGTVALAIFNTIRATGGGLLGVLEDVTGQMAAFVKTAEGKSQLTAVFTAVAAIGAQAGPVIFALVRGLATLAPILGQLAMLLGPILTNSIDALVPGLAGLGVGMVAVFAATSKAIAGLKDSGAIGEFGRAVGVLLAQLSPLISALGSVLVSAFRATAIAARIVAPILGFVARGIAAIAKSPIGIFLGVLVAQFILVRAVTGSWTTALKSLVPVLKLAGKAVLGLGRALLAAIVANPVVAAIAAVVLVLGFLLTRLEPVRRALGKLRDIVVEAFGKLKAFGASLVNTFKTEGPLAALKQLGNGIAGFVSSAATKLGEVAPKIARAILSGIQQAIAALPGLLAKLGGLISAAVQRIGQALPGLAKAYISALVAEFNLIRTVVPIILSGLGTAIVGVFNALRSEGPKIAATIGGLLKSAFSTVASEGPGLISGAFGFLRDAAGTLLAFAASAIRQAGDFIASNLPTIATKIAGLISGLVGTIGRELPKLLNGLASSLGGGVDKAVGDAGAAAAGGGGGEKLKASLGTLITDLLSAIVEQIPKLVPVIISAVAQIQLALLTALVQAVPGILLAIGNLLLTAAGALLSALGSFLLSLPGTLLGLLGTLISSLASLGAQAMFALTKAILQGIGTVIGVIISIPILIVGALGGLAIALFNLGKQAVQKLRDAFAPSGESIGTILRKLPERAAAALAGLGGKIAAKGKQALSALGSAVSSGLNKVGAYFGGLKDKAIAKAKNIGPALKQLGKDALQGFINGAKELGGALIDAITAPISSAVDKAKSLLHINSPSRVFHAIGAGTLEGFINGVNSQSKKAAAVFRKLLQGIVDITGRGFTKAFTGTSASANAVIEKLVKGIQKAFKGKKTSVDNQLIAFLDSQNKSVQKLIKKRDALAETLKKANEFAGQVASDAKGFAGLSSVQADDKGNLSAADVDKQLQDRLKSINKFQADLSALAKRGLNKSSIAQLVGEGVDRGGALAAALASGTSTTLNSINATQKAIDKSATALGKTSADLLFDSGAQAGKGFLAGLKSQQEAIRKLMVDIAKSAADAVRKTLKIKSPSRIMEGLGAFTIEGFLAGIAGLAPEIADALSAAVRIRDDIARKLEKQVTAGAVVPTGSNAPGSGSALTAPRDATASLAAIAVALDRLATAQTSGALRSTEVHAPITVNLPVADPDAAAAIVGRRITNLANR